MPVPGPLRGQASGGSGDILAVVTLRTLDAEPACPPAVEAIAGSPTATDGTRAARDPAGRLTIRRSSVGEVAPATWDALVDRSPFATPFSRWAFHRAWWDGYGA